MEMEQVRQVAVPVAAWEWAKDKVVGVWGASAWAPAEAVCARAVGKR